MCNTNVYTYVYPDGQKEQSYEPSLCPASRHGLPCANEMVFQHPPQYAGYETPMAYGALPPTPSYTPRSTTPNYRSGDESERSFHSSSSSKKKRLSGLYINGQKVLDVERRDRRPSSRHDRIVLVDSPPTPRTPPQTWAAPHTAPSSPNAYVVDASPRKSSSRRHAVIVDERSRDGPHVKIEVVEEKPKRSSKHSHSRHTSTSSRDSRTTDEDEQRRQRKREERKREEKEIREQKLRARIAEANAEIAGRPAVPAAPAPKRASTYKRGVVKVNDQEAELVEAVRRLDFEQARREEKARRLAEKEAAKEEEAQRQRLMERMTPRRRATVGPGSRRPRVLYDDGVYRWE